VKSDLHGRLMRFIHLATLKTCCQTISRIQASFIFPGTTRLP